MFALDDRGRCQCVRAEIVCAKLSKSHTDKPGTFTFIFSGTFRPQRVGLAIRLTRLQLMARKC